MDQVGELLLLPVRAHDKTRSPPIVFSPADSTQLVLVYSPLSTASHPASPLPTEEFISRPTLCQPVRPVTYPDGLTENAGRENDRPSKLKGMKLQDVKMADQFAGHEIAGHENDGPNCRA